MMPSQVCGGDFYNEVWLNANALSCQYRTRGAAGGDFIRDASSETATRRTPRAVLTSYLVAQVLSKCQWLYG
jgi:hypothetical protein